MRKRLILLMIIVSLIISVSLSVEAKIDFNQKLYEDLSQNVNEIPDIKIPDYKVTTLKNGIKIYMLENHKLPYVEIRGYVKGGKILEKKENAGITEFMVSMMETGTQNFTESELDRFKELHGIDFDLNASDNCLYFNGNALTSDKDELLSLTKEILQRPKFDADYYRRLLNERYRGLQQAKTKQNDLASMYYYTNIYPDHPYSFSANIDLLLNNIRKYKPKKLKGYYQKTVVPGNTILIIYGDFTYDKMIGLLQDKFGDWKGKGIEIKEPPVKVNKNNYSKVILVDKPDATQAKIKMGYNITIESFEDRINFKVANQVFGGGDLSCRLVENLRKKKGYVYNINSSYHDRELGGNYIVNTSVKPDKAYETIKLIKSEMNKIKKGKAKIKEKEIFEVVNQWNVFFPESYRYQEDILKSVVYNLEFKDREKNYINKYIQGYNDVKISEANKYFNHYTYPDRFLTIIVGKKEDILPAFQKENIEVQVVTIN